MKENAHLHDEGSHKGPQEDRIGEALVKKMASLGKGGKKVGTTSLC